MAVVAVVMAQFYAAIIVVAWQVVEASSPGDIVLVLLVVLRQVRGDRSRVSYRSRAVRAALR